MSPREGLGRSEGLEVIWAGPSPAPEEALVLATLLGFRFRVWMLSFFIARGRGTWQRQAGLVAGSSPRLPRATAPPSSQPIAPEVQVSSQP